MIMVRKSEVQKLYSSKEVVGKYASFDSRVRQLNIPEKTLIDYYQIHNKKY